MIKYTKGNLLNSPAEALVNTVNTVGVMGKGIALMFKERFPKNMAEYAYACKKGQVITGKMFVTETNELSNPKWIINFPTKQHWRSPSQMRWIEEGLQDLRLFLIKNNVKSVAIPPLGAGNGGLNWPEVKQKIETTLFDLTDIDIYIYEPTQEYQNVTKTQGVKKLTPERAMITELIRRYWILGMECSLLEVQKLAWFLHRSLEKHNIKNNLNFDFIPYKYGPFSNKLNHLLNALDGSYLKAEKRIPDCGPFDVIWFDESQKEIISAYMNSEGKNYLPALQEACDLIDGFESPFGMELLATTDWLISTGVEPNLESIKIALANWPAGKKWADRKQRIFKDRDIEFSLNNLLLKS